VTHKRGVECFNDGQGLTMHAQSLPWPSPLLTAIETDIGRNVQDKKRVWAVTMGSSAGSVNCKAYLVRASSQLLYGRVNERRLASGEAAKRCHDWCACVSKLFGSIKAFLGVCKKLAELFAYTPFLNPHIRGFSTKAE